MALIGPINGIYYLSDPYRIVQKFVARGINIRQHLPRMLESNVQIMSGILSRVTRFSLIWVCGVPHSSLIFPPPSTLRELVTISLVTYEKWYHQPRDAYAYGPNPVVFT